MISPRSPDLQSFLTAAGAAIRNGTHATSPAARAAERIFTALQVPSPESGSPASGRLPVCRYLDSALDHAREHRPTGALADAFGTIEPKLSWSVRAGAEREGPQFVNGHANADIVGLEGIEIRRDVRIGVSLMAPHVRYPDHRHPPEEVYLVLSGGEWRQGDGPWHEPGIGGLVYNPPNIVHAMRSTDRPLLALWFLWIGASGG
jgi:quercetin dioxygenase-like cupin family protein